MRDSCSWLYGLIRSKCERTPTDLLEQRRCVGGQELGCLGELGHAVEQLQALHPEPEVRVSPKDGEGDGVGHRRKGLGGAGRLEQIAEERAPEVEPCNRPATEEMVDTK